MEKNNGIQKIRVAWNKGISNPLLSVRNKSLKMRRINSERMRKNNPMKKIETIKKVSGENSHLWKGNLVGYFGIHKWIVKTLGRANYCSFSNDHKETKYSWANISGSYLRDVNDWSSLCWTCHNHYDTIRRGYLTARGRKVTGYGK